jgi:biopolymer transport protein ExbD
MQRNQPLPRRTGPSPEMNVTPLVDVVLVLLIIFMVITPQMEAGAAVDLPGIFHPDPKTDARHEPITVSLTASGGLYLEKDRVEAPVLAEKLAALRAEFPERRIVLKADRAVPYGDVRTLFSQARELGFPGISLQVGDKKKEG